MLTTVSARAETAGGRQIDSLRTLHGFVRISAFRRLPRNLIIYFCSFTLLKRQEGISHQLANCDKVDPDAVPVFFNAWHRKMVENQVRLSELCLLLIDHTIALKNLMSS